MRYLTEPPYKETVEWSKWSIFWVDERVVPLSSDDSKDKLAHDGFFSKLFVKKKLGLTLSAFCSPTQTMTSLVFGDGALPSKIDGQAHTSSKYSKLEQEMHELKLSMQRIPSRFEKEDENNVL